MYLFSTYLYILIAWAALRALSTASAGERLVVITCLQAIICFFVVFFCIYICVFVFLYYCFVFMFMYLFVCVFCSWTWCSSSRPGWWGWRWECRRCLHPVGPAAQDTPSFFGYFSQFFSQFFFLNLSQFWGVLNMLNVNIWANFGRFFEIGSILRLSYLVFQLLQAGSRHIPHQCETHWGGPGRPGVVRCAHNHLAECILSGITSWGKISLRKEIEGAECEFQEGQVEETQGMISQYWQYFGTPHFSCCATILLLCTGFLLFPLFQL